MNQFRSRVARGQRMTLAAVLFLGALSAAVASPVAAGVAQASTQSPSAIAPANSPSQNQNPPSSSSQPPSQNPAPQSSPATSQAQTSTPSAAKAPAGQNHPQPAHPVRHKKKPANSDCTSAAVASGTSSSAPSDATQANASSGTHSATPSAPANCPPPKVIVRQGGTKETSIQLAGGAGGDQAVQQRATANQMLDATEENLKKIEGRQLTASQQDVVSQIRQFMAQSRSAVKAGELDRARTLAWKAQTLSEELIKPENQ